MIQSLAPALESADRSKRSLGQAELSAFAALFWLTVRQHSRGRRLIVLAFLFLVPAALAITVRYFNPSLGEMHVELAIALTILPHAARPARRPALRVGDD